MKKSLKIISINIIILVLFMSLPVNANMAAPQQADIGSAITFEKNEEITVVSEFLNITVDGGYADIIASYRMKNTTDDNVSTPSMFLSPNIDYSGVSVTVDETVVDFTVESYVLNYSLEVETDDWQYVVLTDNNDEMNDGKMVDTITFQMDFDPNEEYDVIVAYRYQLGGYPEYDFSAKRGEIEYYLSPAAMWNDFTAITIMLYLDEDMPVITQSNIDFEKVGDRTFQYTSDSLPVETLKIEIDENWWQNIFSTLKNPYIHMLMPIFAPIIFIIFVSILFIVLRFRKNKKRGEER